MIYTEEASFPYPILSENSTDYKDNAFLIDVSIVNGNLDYKLEFDIAISSKFLEDLIKQNKVEFISLIKTQDNNFYKLDIANTITINKKNISFKSQNKIQVVLRAKERLNFKENLDLDDFFTEDNEDIFIEKNSIIGFSNVLIFKEEDKKSIDLFEKIVDKDIKSNIKIDIREQNIVLIFREEKYQFGRSPEAKRLIYPYIYMGLQKLIIEMVIMDSKNEDNILEINKNSVVHCSKPVYEKVINLLLSKGVKEISLENVDEIIDIISPNAIDEFYKSVMEVSSIEN